MANKITIDKLVEAQMNLNAEIESIETLLKKYIKFDFFVMYQASDGFVIVNERTTENAVLRWCIEHINKHGKLSYDDYKKYSV
jgi:hypothetical protein